MLNIHALKQHRHRSASCHIVVHVDGLPTQVGKLDQLLTWLWRVHGVDYYAGTEVAEPDAEQRAGPRPTLRCPRPEDGEQACLTHAPSCRPRRPLFDRNTKLTLSIICPTSVHRGHNVLCKRCWGLRSV